MYVTRKELKARAKEALRGKYWHAVGMTLLVALISGIISSIMTLIGGRTADLSEYSSRDVLSQLFGIAAVLFVAFPVSVGFIRYFIKAVREEPDANDLFYCYKNNFWNVIMVNILQSVFIFLWSLLFVIPGIIKSYQYYMINFMLAENPGLTQKRAFDLTKIMMRGNKWRLFVLQMSFIGWGFLCLLTFGIGFIFLEPYLNATLVQFYLELKREAISKGIVNEIELNG